MEGKAIDKITLLHKLSLPQKLSSILKEENKVSVTAKTRYIFLTSKCYVHQNTLKLNTNYS